MFFSGIVSVESMGKIAVYISKILPVTYASDGLSKIIFRRKKLSCGKTRYNSINSILRSINCIKYYRFETL